MATEVLYEPGEFDPLIDEPWVPARVEDAIATIASDADAAFDLDALWPAHEWDGWEEPLPLKDFYVGAAGVIWALDALRRSGHAETSLDLAAAASRTLELKRAEPDLTADEHYHPASLLSGETGPLLVAFRLTSDPALADDLHVLVRPNVANPTDDLGWGAPGTLLAALAMGDWTREPRWEKAARETATALRARRGDDGLWRQDDDYRGLGTLHGAAGNTLVLLRLEADEALAAETAAVLAQHAFREGGLANWPGTPLWRQLARPRDGRKCLQWCTGAPGVLAGAWEYLDEELMLAGAELIWRAGAHSDEKATAFATVRRATGSRYSRRSFAPATSAGSSAPAASPSTRSPKRSGSPRRTAGAATHCSPATLAPHSSPPPASTSTCATRSSMSCRASQQPRGLRRIAPRLLGATFVETHRRALAECDLRHALLRAHVEP